MAESPEGTRQRLGALLHTLVSRTPIAQTVLAIETMDGSFRWAAAEGEPTADGAPMEASTPFFLASIDKLLNATIAMKLVEGGHLDLDERICVHLPQALTRGVHRLGAPTS